MTYDDDCPNCRVEGGVRLCRLHAAAPALLAALHDTLQVLVTPTGFPHKGKGRTERQQQVYESAQKALTQAEGREPQEAER